MKKTVGALAGLLFAAAVSASAAPAASADENGGGGPGNPLLPGCETTGGSAVLGGQTTDCATPGNSQITATPGTPGDYSYPWGDDAFFI